MPMCSGTGTLLSTARSIAQDLGRRCGMTHGGACAVRNHRPSFNPFRAEHTSTIRPAAAEMPKTIDATSSRIMPVTSTVSGKEKLSFFWDQAKPENNAPEAQAISPISDQFVNVINRDFRGPKPSWPAWQPRSETRSARVLARRKGSGEGGTGA